MTGYPNANTLGAALQERPQWLVDAIDRFAARYEVDEVTGCWVWPTRTRLEYGRLAARGRSYAAHRFSYEVSTGVPLPTNLVLDHLCRNRPCVNPAHLEPVAQVINIRRGLSGASNAAKSHCPHGHAYTAANTYVIPKTGGRTCRTCSNRRRQAHDGRVPRAG